MSGHFFANCMLIFHKTEVQTVILMCLMGLNSIWFKSYDTKRKNAEMQMSVFVQNRQKSEMEILTLCVITFEPNRI